MKQPERAASVFVRSVVKRYPFRIALIASAMAGVGLLEGVGLALLIPLLSVLGLGGTGDPGRVGGAISSAVASIGLTLSLPLVLGMFVVVVSIENTLRYFQRRYSRKFIADFSVDLKTTLYDAYLRAAWPFWVRKHLGHLQNRLTVEAQRAENAFYYLTLLTAEAMFVGALMLLAFLLSWQLALFFIAAGGIVFFGLRGQFRAADQRGTSISDQGNALQETVHEHLGAAKFIKTSGTERRSLESVHRLFRGMADVELRANVHNYLVGALLQPIVAVVLAIALYFSLAWLRLDVGRVLVILLVFYRMSPKIATMQQMAHGLQTAAPAFINIRGDLDEARADIDRTAGAWTAAPALERGIVLNRVGFAYPGRDPIFTGLSLEIPALQTTALVGGSGSGKSTLIDLVLRLLRPTSGTIVVDGLPLEGIDLRAWRSRIGYVAQETVLFHDSIRNNIAWARQDATSEQVERAATMANAHDFITRTPEGYDTVVGHRGARLSGGERQRIALARALITEPRLLILDEATSNLDAESEGLVQEAIDGLRSRMTILTVAHRLATVRSADRICVVESGGIVEEGRWDDLVARDGRFSTLWSLQSGGPS